MKKFTKTLILVLFVSFIAKADFVDFNFAKQIAKNHYYGLVDKIPYDQVTLELSHTEFRNGMAMYYVFDVGDNNGFVIISADDNVYPVLGYSFEKNFNESLTNLPPNFSEWMDSYSDQIEYVIQNSLSGDQTIKTKWTELATNAQNPKSTDDVSPLLNTNWDQGQYYNTLCPADPAGPDGHVWAGCVATSMAQVMKYHNHPVQGTGSHSYYTYPYGTLSADFGATTYNWASMPNNVYSYNTSVATLLYHCGVSVDMDYGPDGSGAYTSDSRNSLVDYFSYSPNAAYLCKDNYTTSTWETMLKNQLDASQPMIYSGYGPSGGHAWVCDGYQGTNHFHFNWGWSGYANGYYYVSNLNPGGSTFTEGQCAIFNLYPETTTTLDPPTNLTATVVTGNDVLLEWDPPTGSGSGNWIHWDDQTNSGNGIGLVTGGTLFVASRWTPTDLAPYNGQTITQISFFANDDPAATYVIKAWTGPNAGTLIVSQPVPSFNVNQFNIIDLTTPIVIDASEELWFGYSVTHEEGTYPAGTDDGPAFSNKGDMISMDGDSWESMSIDYGLDYNWNLSAYVESTKTNNPAQPMVKPINQNYATGSFVANGGGSFTKKFLPTSTKALLGYNVYRDGSSIAYATDVSYLDEDLAAGTYNYYTTAVYDEGESMPSNSDNVTIVDGNDPPLNFSATVQDENDVYCTWEEPGTGQTGFSDDFESYSDFVLEFSPWTCIDVDGSTTYGMTDVEWTNAHEPQAFIIFNPTTTTPPVEDIIPHSGNKLAACIAATTPDNNDWLISPQILIESGDELSFWVKSYTADYGLERYKVGISTTGIDPADFTIVSGAGYLEAPATNWEEYTYDLSSYAGDDIYIGIQCVSSDAFIFLVDDFSVGSSKSNITFNPNSAIMGTTVKDKSNSTISGKPNTIYGGQNSGKDLVSYNVYREGNIVANTTELFFLDESLNPGTYSYWATAVYDEGESGPSNIETASIAGTVLNPPTDLVASVTDNDVHLEWETPTIGGGDLVELYQHDGVENNGYFQSYNNGYGVIFDLDVYPGATLEAVDFRHSSWGISGTWDYKIHIVDWDTYTEVALLGTLQTTVNDNWELDVDLGSIAGVSGLVGIFLEPMSNDPEDAYPCIDWDAILDGSSVFGAVADYSAMEVAGGDFLIDLWIMTAGDKQLVQPKKIQANGLPGIKARKSYQPIAGTTLLVNQKENTSNGVKALLGYNIYRDEVLINYTTENEYDDLVLDSGTYDYYVTAVYDEGESNPSNTETVTIGGSGVFPPTNLTAALDDCEIQLTWDPPGSANEWIQWDNGINTGNGIGLTGGGTFNVASRWSPADLAPYNGLTITKISFFPNGDASATFVLKAWTGSNAGTQILSQAVSSFNVDEFNEIDLTSPILIDASQELWFGYTVTGDDGSYPAGCDDGPAIMEYGDQISIDGSSWTGMSGAYGLDYNWNLAAYVESTDAIAPAQPMLKTAYQKISSGSFVASEGGNFSKEFNPSGSKALLGYNIYLKLNSGPYELLDFTSESSFTTEGLPCNEYYFMVTAVYDEGESNFSNEAIVAIPCYPPENLVATVYESVNVHLESDPTVCGTPTAYNFYRDDILIGSNNTPEFEDLDLSPGTYDYYAVAVYSDGISGPSNTETVVIGSLIDPPTNLTATIDDCDIQLTWDPPSGYSSEWIQWDNGENFGNGIGLTGGGTFNVASRWSIADLAPYDGMTITKISFFPNTDINASFVLKAWIGNNAGTQIMSQAVPSYSVDEFNQIDLTSPILIDASQELWFGYEVTHGEDAFPAGCDDGPAIMEYGDQISLDGSTWEGMSGAFGLDYNWNLAAYVESSDAVAGVPAQPMVKTIHHKISTGAFVAKGDGNFSKKFIPSESKELLGYNLYLDGAFLVFVTEETLTFSADPCATYEFIVTAVYDEGESEPSNTVIAEIPCYPPENFTAMVFENMNAHLECDPPVCGTPSSYNFYRDGSLIGSSALPEYDDLDLLPGTYEYYATVNWIDEESGPSNSQTINIEVILDPPTNLTGPEYITYGNAIDLMWDAPSSSKDLLGYNVYRSFNYDPFELQGYTTEESYSDMEYIYEGLYVYYVTAVYDEGESEPSNEHEVDVLEGIEDHLFNAVQFFPNPATEIVNIKSDYNIELLKVYSFTGQEVVSEIVNKTRHTINTSVYEPGLYIFQVDTKEGRIIKRIVIR